ncbi:MAG: DUF4412 domain-containing protein [Flavobacteriaceae bacterium]
MKTNIFISVSIAFMVSIPNANAQFLDKLTKKVEKRVEQTVINKTADKAAQKTSQSMDKVFDPKLGGAQSGKKVTPTDVPGSFDFDYRYQMTMTTSQGQMKMDYFLKPNTPYLGVKMNQGMEMFMVMDGEKNINYMFMESGGNKIGTATSLDASDITDTDDYDMSDYTVTDLPNKTFLGYNCEGKKMENEDYVFIIYYTNDAEVSFNDVYKTDPERIPDAVKSQFEGAEDALMMYMDMKDKKNKGKRNTSGTMECTALEPTDFSFNTSGYRFM